MWRPTIVLLHLHLAIVFSTGYYSNSPVSKSPSDGDKCMERPKKCKNTIYRSIDGSCNNLKHSFWGVPNRAYGRLIGYYNYADGKHKLPTSSSGKPLPNARLISRELFPPKDIIDPEYTLLTMQFGQFVTHDMSLTADSLQLGEDAQPVVCCRDGKLGANAKNTDQCAPIEISPDDPDFGPAGIECLTLTRTGTTRDRGCSGPDEVAKPLSAVTAWMDLSLVYGSSIEQAEPLREFEGGRLRTATREGQEWPPQQDNVTQSCPAVKSNNEPCYKFGDVRSNQNPQLTSLQIVFLREHNRIANDLSQINRHWDDEKLFQEARRINIAQYQYITYHEYLPIILGKERMIKEKILFPDAKKCVDDYDSSVDPAVYDEHANGGAFRNFHSAIIGHLQLLDEKRSVTAVARLSDWVNRPVIQEANDTVNFDHLVRGMTTQHEQYVDQYVDMEIFKHLFKDDGSELGIDLHATDIQRSRDHGIPFYVDARKAFNLPVPKNFGDLSKICGISKKNVKKLKTLYKNLKDVELIVGGGLEPLIDGTLSGETFLYILTKMFKKTRQGDRFFFQNCEDNKFTQEQLRSIQTTSMAKVFCDNSEIESMQPRAFEGVCDDNPLTSCHKLKGVDLTLWRDGKAKPSKKSHHKYCD